MFNKIQVSNIWNHMEISTTEAIIYVIYILLSIVCFIVSFLLILFYCIKGDMRSNSQKITLNLLISTSLVSLSSVLSLTRICELCEGMQLVALYSAIMWMTFTNFLTSIKMQLKWTSALFNMIFFSYFLPFISYLICQLTLKLELLDNSLYCTFYKKGDIISIVLMILMPTILMIYNLIMSYRSLRYLNKAIILYPFLRIDILQQKIIPVFMMILLLPYFYIIAGYNLAFTPKNDQIYDIIDGYCHLTMQLGVLLMMLVYGINPTLQKTQVLRNIQKFRVSLKEELKSDSISRRSTPSLNEKSNFSESELSKVEPYLSQNDDIIN